jgi:uncharacterized membrane protein YgdD (TMEM256/DUF423 family)
MGRLSRLILAIGYMGGAVLLLLLLVESNVDALTARVGFTTISVIVLGLVAAAGARLLYHPEPVDLWGWATRLIAAVTFVLILVEVWREQRYTNETRTAVMVVISLLLGGGSLVLSGEDEGIEGMQPARRGAIVALLALGVLTVLEASGVHIGPRWFGVASVLFFVPVLTLPFLRLAGAEESGVNR